MTDNKEVTLVVMWNKQRRQISINTNYDKSNIVESINNAFELESTDDLSEYQIQFYDKSRETFMDLYSVTSNLFKEVLIKLSSLEAPPQTSKEWFLNIVRKSSMKKNNHRSDKPITDDTYNYQQENEIAPFSETDQTLSTNSSKPIDLPVTGTFVTEESSISNANLLPLEMVATKIIISESNPYGLGFICDLAHHQRSQFESEMIRKTSSKSNAGGVLLQSVSKFTAVSNTEVAYPVVHFQIPAEQLCLKWYMYIYVLTAADGNRNHYLHASKGIFDNYTKDQDKFGRISNTQLVNPFTTALRQDDLRDGRYIIHIKVCNIKNLPARKLEELRKFPKLNSFLICEDETLKSCHTSTSLNFSNDDYHIGCILVRENISRDQCISSLTVAEKNRKRRDTEPSISLNTENLIKKSKQNY